MKPLTPSWLIATAQSYLGIGDDEMMPIREPLAQAFLRQVGAPEGLASPAWHAAFIWHVGFWSHCEDFDVRSSWPFPPTSSLEQMERFAESRGVLHEEPRAGDIFLLASGTRGTFSRGGIVIQVLNPDSRDDGRRFDECLTIEGDPTGKLASQGAIAIRRLRLLSSNMGDRFIRWSELDRRGAAGMPMESPVRLEAPVESDDADSSDASDDATREAA